MEVKKMHKEGFEKDKSDMENKMTFFSWGFHIFDMWIQIKNKGKSLERFFEDNSICHIAIYGMGIIGKRLYEELYFSSIKIKYAIDRNADNIQVIGLDIKTLEDTFPLVDAIIVTPIDFYEIEKKLYEKMGKEIDIIFIEDIVNYCFNLL